MVRTITHRAGYAKDIALILARPSRLPGVGQVERVLQRRHDCRLHTGISHQQRKRQSHYLAQTGSSPLARGT